ncbi:DUF86 domain-containing protein [Magnetospirillum sp. UT-4]|uniref:HepT-like ribonuclease domain-containing protein n=1 Tax=Magnetospirillum sp. UT-4 TaxID=2681467 RepID=UPI0013844820|nr:HepT-like ribonuclease domain-containing protein [Magnetospirillum sp. UT-4]CAA7620753.1 conserved hypothetical protein [Magnetospirillum sp. UT-4]
MPSSNPGRRLSDIIDMCDDIAAFVADMSDPAALRQDRKTFRAVERCLLIIAEAATKLGPAADALCPGIPWRDVRGLGNVIRHEYDGLDANRIWATVQEDLPPLRAACVAALEKLRH